MSISWIAYGRFPSGIEASHAAAGTAKGDVRRTVLVPVSRFISSCG